MTRNVSHGVPTLPADFRARFEALCAGELSRRAVATDRGRQVSPESWRALADVGFLRLFHATEHGGFGADPETIAWAMARLARACASTYWASTISAALCGQMLSTLCAPHHHAQWLEPILRGVRIGCFAATEVEAGSDPGSYRTTVLRTDRGLVLRGRKSRIANGPVADVGVILARDGDPTGSKLCYVVVDLRHPRVHRAEQPKLGLRGMSWGTLDFEDVPVSERDIVRDADIERTMQTVEWGQLVQAWCGIGLAERAFEEALAYTRGRAAFGRTLLHLDLVHARLVELQVAIEAARLLVTDATTRKLSGAPAREQVMLAKVHATELAVRVADDAMRCFGGWGYAESLPIERLYRDSLANVPAGLPTDRLREIVGCMMVGENPWVYDGFDGAEGLSVG